MRFVKLEGSNSASTNWTSEYILEVDPQNGVPVKVVRKGEPIKLSNEEIAKLESVGAVFVESSAAEKKAFDDSKPEEVIVGSDVAAGLPSLAAAGVDQPEPVAANEASTEDKSTTKSVQSGSVKPNKQ